MSILVQKFGGSSVADVERIQNVARKVAASKEKNSEGLVVVVSAMGKTTDRLVGMAREISSQPHAREMDMLLATGEQVTIALLCMALHELGFKAVSMTGAQAGIITENRHNKAKIINIDTEAIRKLLAEDFIVVVAGFQGVTPDHQITTLGRGGSDTTAVALAGALDAPVCEIYTDVDGVYTTDPNIVSEAQKLQEISYEEMLELAQLGAKVLHPRSVECAKKYGTMVHVRSSFNTNEGTYVKPMKDLEIHRPVTGVTADARQAKVAIRHVPDRPGVAAQLFGALAEKGISVDMIIQSVQENLTNDIAFTVHEDDLTQAIAITQAVADQLGAKDVVSDGDVAKVSIVGVGMIGTPGIAAEMFEALSKAEINIQMISTSEIKISCVVQRDQVKKAMQVIHEHFVLPEDSALENQELLAL
ncbi:aspartate kinase [bacterium (Candidatus Blackallbacteria) CG17_big_fil_post_rev_8_21_14_2_50_48_46]|uniref:Aspartokinase n=1 Tax=bacterium (Candidatus Blackallbacteria) CG17_big_fil_post_rev_8_21_14_2_50_48_46 TaxID=2014261 RepID=A0A2M7G4V1_9BACT|nr:MAG: aspartate kinase [bacterium (Candidatus Blackallbacteria) CG18_big_fil_WC_8_21_14_2_50_49_26]PIW16564.1 MAG: aspartate kinase [bacterium (Candidatus Blackallbacteria) CG17_big_fil_post_rev_8_21_14_2_50_48_46]PIW46072.1 MAG: aspartate kinase [bacterium (Candidatus Blackallbacteria) CG13_big_fil_rev_8_21_14_2_50_49_14]